MNLGTTLVTRKGQITVPIRIREELGLKEGDKLAFIRSGQEITIKRSASVVLQTAGVLQGNSPALSPPQLREAAEDAIADEAIARSKG